MFSTTVAASGFVLGLSIVMVLWLQRELRFTVAPKIRLLMVFAFSALPLIGVFLFWSATAAGIALATALIVGVVAYICYSTEVDAQQGISTPRWLKWL